MLISVVVVTFSTPSEMLGRCIASARASVSCAGCECEVICVDNGYTAFPAAAALRPNRCLTLGSNVGFARASNLGVAHARGELVLVLNPDAAMEIQTVAHLQDALGVYKGRALVGAWLLSEGSRLQVDAYLSWSSSISRLVRRRRYAKYLADNTRSISVPVEKVAGGAFLAPRSVLIGLGPFEETFFLYGEDDDLSRRSRREGIALAACPQAIVRHTGGYSSRRCSGVAERARVDAALRLLRRHHGPLATWAGISELLAVTIVGLALPGLASSASRRARRSRLRELGRWIRHRADAPPFLPPPAAA